MRQEWLMVLLVVVLFVSVGCGTKTVIAGSYSPAAIEPTPEEESDEPKSLTTSDTYTVRSGDTLMEISRKFFNGDSQYWDEIAELNGIKAPYTIYPGQELKLPQNGERIVPASVPSDESEQTPSTPWYKQRHGPWFYELGGTGTVPAASVQAQASTASNTYTVQSGDCLMDIARKLLGAPHRWREIADMNGLGSPYTIHPGQELKVPEK